jgi:hypothetical protein
MQKREYPRLEVPHLQADVSDGKGFFTGSVKNISRFGLAITDIPLDLDNASDIYSVILDGPGTHFKLLVRPLWETNDGVSKTIGTRIENSPWTWTDFVMRQETLSNQILVEQTAH